MIVIVALSYASEPNGPAYFVDVDKLPSGKYKSAILEAMGDESKIAEMTVEGLEDFQNYESTADIELDIEFPFIGRISDSVVIYLE